MRTVKVQMLEMAGFLTEEGDKSLGASFFFQGLC